MIIADTQPRSPARWLPRFSLKTLMLLVLLAAVVCALVLYWDYIPGTIRLDKFNNPHGTGWSTRSYNSGAPMEKAYYRAGELIEKIWYKPDGSVAASFCPRAVVAARRRQAASRAFLHALGIVIPRPL